MQRSCRMCLFAVVCLFLLVPAATLAGDLRNVKVGDTAPAFKLQTIDGSTVELASLKGSVAVVVCLAAEQRNSESAAIESARIVSELKTDQVKLVHVTADVENKAYFQKFRSDHALAVPLGFDSDRGFYHALGMVVFPTTLVIDQEGKLSGVIALSGPDYSVRLDVYIRKALGQLTQQQVEERLKALTSQDSAQRKLAGAQRSAARLLRQKGRLIEAQRELRKACEEDPADIEAALDLADVDLGLGQVDEAEKIIADVLKKDPQHRRAGELNGICLFRQGKLDEAQKVLLDVLKLNPEPGRIHYYLGRIYEQKGDCAKAIEHYRLALEKALNEPEPARSTEK